LKRLLSNTHVVCLGLFLISFQSCKHTKIEATSEAEKLPIHIDLINNLENKKDLFLSDFADSVSYVALETSDNSLLPEMSKVIPVKGGYLIIANRHPLFYFDASGKFIRKIGGIGSGPGEYKFCWMTQYDPGSELIYVCENYKKLILVFTLAGTYCKSIKFNDLATGFHVFNNRTIFLYSKFSPSDPNLSVLSLLDSTGTLISSFERTIDRAPVWSANTMEIYVQCDPSAILLPNSFSDTVFQLNEDFEVTPFCTYNVGNHLIPPDILDNRELFIETSQNYIAEISTWAYPSIIITRFHYQGKSYTGYYQKSIKEFHLLNNPDSLMGYIKNDLDGGPSFSTGTFEYYNASTQISYRLIQPVYLLDYKKKAISPHKI